MSFHPGILAASRRRAVVEPPPVSAVNWSDVKLLISAEGASLDKHGFGNIADAAAIVVGSGGLSQHVPIVKNTTSPFAGGQAFGMSNYTGGTSIGRWSIHGSVTHVYTGPFTLEGWAYPTDYSTSSQALPIASAYTAQGNSWVLRSRADGASMEFRFFDASNVEHSASWAPRPPLNVWYHWCIERDNSNTVRVYIDGVVRATFSDATFWAPTQDYWFIGHTGNGSTSEPFFRGFMADVRLTKAAVYAAPGGFTRPSAPFPRGAAGAGDPHFASVVYLMADHTDKPLTSLQYIGDRSRVGTIFTANNSAITTANQRGTRVGDWSFTNAFSTRSVVGAGATPFNFWDRSIPFTAEAFIRPDSSAMSGIKMILGMWDTSPAARQWMLCLDGSAKPAVHLSSDGAASTTLLAANSLVVNTWYHVALCRDHTATYRLFVNGAVVVTQTAFQTQNLYNPPVGDQQFLTGGSYVTSQAFTGQYHGARVTHGVDRYSDGAGAPTADAFPAYGVAG